VNQQEWNKEVKSILLAMNKQMEDVVLLMISQDERIKKLEGLVSGIDESEGNNEADV